MLPKQFWKLSAIGLVLVALALLAGVTQAETQANGNSVSTDLVPLTQVKDLIVGEQHNCVITQNNVVMCWGLRRGNGYDVNTQLPQKIEGLENVKKVYAGYGNSCATFSGGAVKCWGYNEYGQLGNGSQIDSLTPVDVIGLSNVTKVALGAKSSCALQEGRVKCWGDNYYGQLGNGTIFPTLIATDVVSLTNVIDLEGGDHHYCAVKDDQTVMCWGRGTAGQLGNGTLKHSSVPVAVHSLSNVESISVGKYHTCALLTDHTVKCWGSNSYGQLGKGNATENTVPNPAQISNVQAISLGSYHSCALMLDSTVKCWGSNLGSVLGDLTITNRPTPVNVVALSGVVQLGAGDDHNCVLMPESTVRCWGLDPYGQLGNGSELQESKTHEYVLIDNSTEPTPTPIPTEQPCPNCGLVEVQGKVAIWNGEQDSPPASGVTLQFIWDGRQKTATTDQNGHYQLFLEPNLYTVTAHKDNHLVVYEVENVDGVVENTKELTLNVQENMQITAFLALPCLSPVTGLNICQLQKGDILLEDSNESFDNQAALVTSYFLHAALGDTDANIIEAAGNSINADERGEVRKIAVQHTGFYKQTFELDGNQEVVPVVVNDWLALRVKDEYKNKVDGAVEYATNKAYDPSVTYNADFLNPDNKNREDVFYCSQLVWRAYFEQGLDLDTNLGFVEIALSIATETIEKLSQQVLPDDLYASASGIVGKTTIVQAKPGVDSFDRIVWSMWSPAEIHITDAMGRSVGYDPDTKTMISDMPGAYYTEVGSDPKWIRALVSGTVTVDVFGTGAGEYSLVARSLKDVVAGDYFHHKTQNGQHDVFTFSATDEQVKIIPISVGYSVYLPLVQK